LPNIYTSSGIIAPAKNSDNSLSKISNQLSGLSGIGGIRLPRSGDLDEIALAIETIKSLDFYINFVTKHDLLVNMIASDGWNSEKNIIIIDDELYDLKSKKWIADIKFSSNGIPSFQYAHRKFLKDDLRITRDDKSGFVTVSYKHHSPYFSSKVVRLLIEEINEIKRADDIEQARKSISFLENQIESTKLAEVKTGLSELVQMQIKTIMVAKSTPEYLFKYASPPYPPELKSEPSRAQICILLFFLGFISSSTYSLIRYYYFK